MMLYEKYRPITLKDFIGQDDIKRRLQVITGRDGWDRDSFWIQGPSGSGKTTLAFVIAAQYCHDFDIDEIDGDKCNQQAVRDLEQSFAVSSMFGGWKCVIVNEAHAMSKPAVQAWLHLLERLPAKRLVIFTTTENITANLFGSFSGPFGSRCKILTFSKNGLSKLFAKRAQQIARKENLDGQPLTRYDYLVRFCNNNFRQVLQRIEAGEMLAAPPAKKTVAQKTKRTKRKVK